MRPIFKRGGTMSVLQIILPAAGLLGGCASGTVTSSANPSRAPASNWTDFASLPVELHGVVPGHSKAELAALFPAFDTAQYASLGTTPSALASRRMVLFVNPAAPLAASTLCEGRGQFQRGVQPGDLAYVTGALCDGTRVISTASAFVRTQGMSPPQIAYNFHIVRDQLYQSLFPGANSPWKYYE